MARQGRAGKEAEEEKASRLNRRRSARTAMMPPDCTGGII
jgi:hypothetical protein